MKKSRLIFYAIFALFHIVLIIFTFYVDSKKNDFGTLFGLLGWLPAAKVGSIIGMILLVIDIIWARASVAASDKANNVLEHELKTLKAKLFDLQEASRNSSVQPGQPNPRA